MSVFDVSDASNPDVLQDYTEQSSSSSAELLRSSSAVRTDPRALRYHNGLLIVPLTVGAADSSFNISFDGFRVYNVSDETATIEPYMSIEHVGGDDPAFLQNKGCWRKTGFLNSRSFIFDHDIMTFRGHSILSYDIDTKAADADPILLDQGLSDANGCTTETQANPAD